ncbi:MAG TPA: hypothetical protein DDY72_00435 [Verrucomicrobia bacterium]|nr:hypothetical protein [Verrucomicrobiota bacterium]
MKTRLEAFGWRGPVEPGLGRVVSAHGDYYHVVCNEAEGEILARTKKSVFAGKATKARIVGRGTSLETGVRGEEGVVRPMTGDFVRLAHNRHGDSLITELLPRFSKFERRDPTARRKAQTLAVNFDWLFVMMSLNENFSVARVARYLELAADVGAARVAVVLTKTDLRQPEDAPLIADLRETIGDRAAYFEISCLTGEGLAAIRALEQPGQTLAFVGSSGVGKSTLLNTLAGEEWAATGEVQEWSGKGRHTTTSRELVRLPSGALVLDTPGIREIGILGEREIRLQKGESTHRRRK